MRILIALTYYLPHVSGLTIYVQRLARALARRGHSVTVMTSQYERSLPRREKLDEVEILRIPVAFRVSKGVVMPTVGMIATRLAMEHDVLSLHLPQLDAAGIALRGRLMGKPTLLTYHSDLRLPAGAINAVANRVVNAANHIAGRLADAIVAYTQDFADHSPFLSRFREKIRVIPPPVEITPTHDGAADRLAECASRGRPIIGMAARLATEKGVEFLLEALPMVLERFPHAQVLFAGAYRNVLGEEAYARRLAPGLKRLADHWTFLGVLRPDEMTAFYESCDLTVLPSVNSTETFGLVQIESMICQTPVVASNLPGVRQPVLTTGMGEVVPIRDAGALAGAILKVLERPSDYRTDSGAIARKYSPSAVAQQYEDLFQELLRQKQGPG